MSIAKRLNVFGWIFMALALGFMVFSDTDDLSVALAAIICAAIHFAAVDIIKALKQ